MPTSLNPTWAALRSRADVSAALEYLREHDEAHLQAQIEIAQVPAPAWHEADRAAVMAGRFRRAGLTRPGRRRPCSTGPRCRRSSSSRSALVGC